MKQVHIEFESFQSFSTVLEFYNFSDVVLNFFLALITPLFSGKKVRFAPPKNLKDGLRFIIDLIEKGNFRPVINRKYPIEKIAEAFKYVASGQKKGNVIITMDA